MKESIETIWTKLQSDTWITVHPQYVASMFTPLLSRGDHQAAVQSQKRAYFIAGCMTVFKESGAKLRLVIVGLICTAQVNSFRKLKSSNQLLSAVTGKTERWR